MVSANTATRKTPLKITFLFFFISSSPFCQPANFLFDPAAESFVYPVEICLSSDEETEFSKKDSPCHVYDHMLFRKKCGCKYQNRNYHGHALIPARNFFPATDSQITEPAYQTVDGRKQIVRRVNRIQPQSCLIPQTAPCDQRSCICRWKCKKKHKADTS